MGSLEPLIVGPSPPLKVTLLQWGCCPAPLPLSGNVMRLKYDDRDETFWGGGCVPALLGSGIWSLL